MAQIIEKIMEQKGRKSEQIESEENLGELNPRYFEEGMSPENALEKAKASHVSNFTVRPY